MAVAAKKTTARPNFAQFRQKLQQQQQEQEAEAKVIGTILAASPSSEVKTFDGGFFKVDSPVQKKTQASTGWLFIYWTICQPFNIVTMVQIRIGPFYIT